MYGTILIPRFATKNPASSRGIWFWLAFCQSRLSKAPPHDYRLIASDNNRGRNKLNSLTIYPSFVQLPVMLAQQSTFVKRLVKLGIEDFPDIVPVAICIRDGSPQPRASHDPAQAMGRTRLTRMVVGASFGSPTNSIPTAASGNFNMKSRPYQSGRVQRVDATPRQSPAPGSDPLSLFQVKPY